MRAPQELKQLLIEIKDNDYAAPDDMDGIIDDMLAHIGNPDGELRDKLIYSTFYQWCEEKAVVSTTQMRHILDTCISDTHLFHGIGESGTDSVFTRAFSSLLINIAFCVHYEQPFLSVKDIQDVKAAVLRYISEEKDYRGYIDGKGWAHAVAHIADALLAVAGVEKAADIEGDYSIGREGMQEVLHAVKFLVCNKEHIYSAEEDERLVIPFMVVTDSKALTTQELIDWIDSFNMANNQYWKGDMPADYYSYVNRKNFMRSLYFMLRSQIETEGFADICKFMEGFLIESDE